MLLQLTKVAEWLRRPPSTPTVSGSNPGLCSKIFFFNLKRKIPLHDEQPHVITQRYILHDEETASQPAIHPAYQTRYPVPEWSA